MSQTVNAQIAAPVKKERKPTLSDKYSKFLVSNFNLIKILETKELISAEAVEAAYSEIKLLAPIEEQVEYYEAFLASAKGSKGNPGIKSQMKKFVTQRNKPPKAPRVKKERKPKTETTDAAANETQAKKERKPRAKKETKVSDDTQNDVVAQLVEAANSSMSPTNVAESSSAPVEAATEAPAKKTRKPRTKKEEGAETKPKKTKTKKEKVVEAPVQEDEEEISTNEFIIGDTKYLIDSENNLYDINTHEEVGTYDASTSSVIPISA